MTRHSGGSREARPLGQHLGFIVSVPPAFRPPRGLPANGLLVASHTGRWGSCSSSTSLQREAELTRGGAGPLWPTCGRTPQGQRPRPLCWAVGLQVGPLWGRPEGVAPPPPPLPRGAPEGSPPWVTGALVSHSAPRCLSVCLSQNHGHGECPLRGPMPAFSSRNLRCDGGIVIKTQSRAT